MTTALLLQIMRHPSWLVVLPLAVALVGGGLRFYRLPLALRYLVGVVAWSLLLELVALLLKLPHPPSLLVPLGAVGELTLLVLLYQAVLHLPWLKRWLPVGFVVAAAGALLSGLASPAAGQLRLGLQVAENCLLLLLAVLYFRQLLHQLVVRHLEREPLFWLSAGLFIYCLGSLQLALFSEYLAQHAAPPPRQLVWLVDTLLLLVLNSCYAVALWMHPPK